MTSCLFVAILTLSQTPQAPAPASRETIEIRREVSELLKAESTAESDVERARLVQRMTEVYLEIVRDDRFATNSFLQQQRTKLWTRLVRVRDEIKRRRPDLPRTNEAELVRQQQVAQSLSDHLQLVSQTLGGPSAVISSAAGGGSIDFGDDLVDLITNTINPDHWNVNGGPGSIMFYRPALALVVRASSEVQGRVGEGIGALRAAGP